MQATKGTVKETLRTPDAFEAWLRSLDKEALVGYPNDWYACPIARFIRTLSPKRGLFSTVDGDHIIAEDVFDNWREVLETPEWAIAFIDAIDEGQLDELQASEALSILSETIKAHRGA